MATRVNGKAMRSGCDIAGIMASINGLERYDDPEAREGRIATYAHRAGSGLDLWTGEPLAASGQPDDDQTDDEPESVPGWDIIEGGLETVEA